MIRKVTVAAFLAMLVATGAAAQDAKAVLSGVSQAMGAQNLTSITYSGTASDVYFLQTRSINGPWPLRPITAYTRAIDLNQLSMRSTGLTNNPGPFGGAPAAGTHTQNIAANSTSWAQLLDYWITPWGFLKGAAANNATARPQRSGGKNYLVVTWSPATPKAPSGIAYSVNGYVNDQNLIERIETWVEHDIFGDLHVETLYTEWKDLGGVKVPTRVVQKRGGWPFFETDVTAARPNPSDITQLLAPPGGGGRGGGGGGGGGRGGAAAPAAGAAAPAAGGAPAAAPAGGRGGQAPGAVPPVPTAAGAAAAAAPPRGGAGGGG